MAIYLLTGAAGLIGAQTTELLLKEGHTVIGLDNLNDYYSVRLKHWRANQLNSYENFKFIEGDVEDSILMEQLLKEHKFDAILHLAARAGPRASLHHPLIYYSTNLTGTLHLLELMRMHDIQKLVMASTSSLYAGQPMPFVEDLPLNEPISPYAASKKAAELAAYTWHRQYGLDISILRYFTVYGPAGRPDMAVFRFIEAIYRGNPLTIYGDGSQSRDFTFCEDVARGTIAALKPVGYGIYNIGGGNQPVSLNDLIETIQGILGKSAIIEHQPFHKADFKINWADISKARKTFGWKPETSLQVGIEKTVQWHLAERKLLDLLDAG